MNKPKKEQLGTLEEQDAPMILEDPELARLALYLRQTPLPIIDPAHRDALQSMLVETVFAQKQRKSRDEMDGERTGPETGSKQNIVVAGAKTSTDGPDMAALEDDAEFAILARHL